MPLVLSRNIKRHQIHPVNLEASGKRDDGRTGAGEKGKEGQEGKGRGRMRTRHLLDVCGHDCETGKAVSGLRGTYQARQGYD